MACIVSVEGVNEIYEREKQKARIKIENVVLKIQEHEKIGNCVKKKNILKK